MITPIPTSRMRSRRHPNSRPAQRRAMAEIHRSFIDANRVRTNIRDTTTPTNENRTHPTYLVIADRADPVAAERFAGAVRVSLVTNS